MQAPAADAAAAAEAVQQEVAALEARVAALHYTAQALNKQPGAEAQATEVYKELAALDDKALELRLAHAPLDGSRMVQSTAAFPAYCSLPPPPPSWRQAAAASMASSGSSRGDISATQLRQRALGAILGAAVGDAAACGVQWVYSEATLQSLVAEGRLGLEFYEPPQCPFFDYPAGAASPYGEQTAALLHSLVEAGGLDCCAYAATLFATFGPGFEGYRDRSTKSFLRRYAAGALPPLTGSPDDQANCFTRLPPLVALYAGGDRRELICAVEHMIRVTQNDGIAVAYGCAASLILEGVILGASAAAAVAEAVDWLLQQEQGGAAADEASTAEAAAAAGGTTAEQQQQDAAAVPAVPAALWGEAASRLVQAAELAWLPPLEAAARLGRNCHLPNSLQTPIQVLLHVEQQQLRQQQHGVLPTAAASGQQSSAPTADGNSPPQQTREQQSAAEDDFCLPCSMGGGTACALPGRKPGQAAAGAGNSLLQAAKQQQHGGEGAATLPAEAYVEAVRMAIRPGGCCASRAGFAGALAGALTAGAAGVQLPTDWVGRMRGYAGLVTAAGRLVSLRD